jgi:hypothetical protein
MPNPTHRSLLGAVREAVKGTPITTPALYIPVKTFGPGDEVKYHPDEGIRGSAVLRYNQIAGPIWANYDFGGDVFSDTFGIPMGGIFGENAATGTGGAATTLSASYTAGAATCSVTAVVTASQLIQVGVGNLAEVRKASSVSGAGPYIVTLDNPMSFSHANAAAVQVGVAAPFTYTFYLRNAGDLQPASFTIADRYLGAVANNTRFFPGMQFSEVSLKFNADGLLEYSAKAVGFTSAIGTDPVSSYSAIVPEATWTGTTTIGGGSVLYAQTGEIVFKRKAEPIHTIDSTQGPYKIWVGPLEVTGKMTVVMEDDTEYTRYLTNTQPSLDLNWSQALPLQQQVKVHATKAAYTLAKIERSKDYVELSIDFDCMANVTDIGQSGGYAPATVQLQSNIGSVLYT